MLKKNNVLTIQITDQGKTGDGLAFFEEVPIYTPNCIPGDTIELKIIKVEKRRAFGRCLKILEPSANRVKPQCDVASQCGGCQLQHQSMSSQLEFKELLLKSRLSRYVTLAPAVFRPMIPSKAEYGFRNKMQFAFSMNKGTLAIGLYAPRSHRVIDTPHCPVMSDAMNQVLVAIKQWHKIYPISVFNELNGDGILRYLTIRYSHALNQLMVVITGSKEWGGYEFLVKQLSVIKGMKSMYYSIQKDPKNDQVIGADLLHIWGEETIDDRVLDLMCLVSPKSFVQGNAIMVDVLYQTLIDGLGLAENDDILDLYCGTGVMTMALARALVLNRKEKRTKDLKRQSKVIGIDDNESAISDAIRNAELNQIDVKFGCEKVEHYLNKNDCSDSVIILDPPRQGCHPKVLSAICNAQPKKIGMMSCNVDTLGRDLNILMDGGYIISSIQGVDMFCHTAHIELIIFMGVSQNNQSVQF